VLGYRLIGRDLVLWDEEAEIVLDFVTNALPPPSIWEFVDASSFELRRLLRAALVTGRIDPGELRDDIERDTRPGARRPSIGERFDWGCGTMMPPTVLQALPPLPPPLEYRFAGADLVVIDVRTGIVRGILADVLPSAARFTVHSA
jgi:hypothetical protein